MAAAAGILLRRTDKKAGEAYWVLRRFKWNSQWATFLENAFEPTIRNYGICPGLPLMASFKELPL